MDIIQYSKIKRSDHKNIQQLIFDNLNKECYVTEKIHGTNFSIRNNITSSDVYYASRSQIIDSDNNFNNYKMAMDKINYDDIMMVFSKILKFADLKILNSEHHNYTPDDITEVCIFGELFGGDYPGYQSNVAKIQKGVYYSKNIEFLIFDLCYVINNEKKIYVDFKTTIDIINNVKTLDTVPILTKLTIKDSLSYPNDNESIVYNKYGLDKVKDNISEGVVIKTAIEFDNYKIPRLSIKSKNEKFAERKQIKKGNKKIKLKLPSTVLNLLNEVDLYITKNRAENLFSKYSVINKANFNEYKKEYFIDVLDDSSLTEEFHLLHKDDQKLFTNQMYKKIAPIIGKTMSRYV